jgi:predicted TPR repeat methyltransferase
MRNTMMAAMRSFTIPARRRVRVTPRKAAPDANADPIAAAQALVDSGKAADAVTLLQTRLRMGRGGPLMRIALGRAQNVAGDGAAALATLREASALAPGLAEAPLALGEILLAQGHLPTAIAELTRAANLAPEDARVRLALGRAWLAIGEAERAREFLAPLAEADTGAARALEIANAMLSAPRSPAPYVRHLFDQFSADYDSRMLGELHYRAPSILRALADMVGACAGAPLAILDLGCGTGLGGEAFRDVAERIDGVDLSPLMLEKARERALYETLTHGDIETALAGEGRQYDLIIAADTLVYLGDLAATFAGAARRLAPDGFFLFTVEKKAGAGFELGPKRRYRHSEAYIRAEAAKIGLQAMGVLACSPRDEAHAAVEGLAVALCKA